jgi:threonine dehydrogenase-like Zn-dependent dehydrogenase
MRATFMYGPGDVRVIDIEEPAIKEPRDAIVRVIRSCICGSDIRQYRAMPVTEGGRSVGHEFVGVVEDVGAEVRTIGKGDFVIAPLVWSDGTCDFCREGLHTSCRNGGLWNGENRGGCQAEAVRVPQADGTLVATTVEEDSPLIPSLLTLCDVYGTGYHAAVKANVSPRTSVTVIGDGAVGLLAVLSAKQLGAERIILMSHHERRAELARQLGATDIVAERGDAGVAAVHELTYGDGTHVVIEAVGHKLAFEQAIGIVRVGGTISQIGVPKGADHLIGFDSQFGRNITLTGGLAPTRAYIEHLLPHILGGGVDPGLVFDHEVDLDHIQDGYRAMDTRQALKVIVRP